jgi:Kef-type K+ transport system membrane component KefB
MLLLGLAIALAPLATLANTASDGTSGPASNYPLLFFFVAILVLLAKVGGTVKKWGQPPVLGELMIGVILGNLGLLGFHLVDELKNIPYIAFLAELGVILLLFQIGLESNIDKMKKAGIRAFLVATVGLVIPFALGTYIVGPWLLPGLDFNAYLFLGAILTATSVGITARVFKDLNCLQSKEAQIVLGAAVIDDVMGLVVLAIVTAVVTVGSVSLASIGIITLKAFGFLIGAIVVGSLVAPFLGKFFSSIRSGAGMMFGLAFAFCFTFAYIASLFGLAPIVGAFAAGLILDPVHFKTFRPPVVAQKIKELLEKIKDKDSVKEIRRVIEEHEDRHVENLIENTSRFLVPVFFVYTGLQVNLSALFNVSILLIALAITVVAIVGKIVSGLAAGRGVSKLTVGFGMIPRGEVGIIFANVGKQLGVVNDQIFGAIMIVIILTTLLAPPLLSYALKRQNSSKPIVRSQ